MQQIRQLLKTERIFTIDKLVVQKIVILSTFRRGLIINSKHSGCTANKLNYQPLEEGGICIIKA